MPFQRKRSILKKNVESAKYHFYTLRSFVIGQSKSKKKAFDSFIKKLKALNVPIPSYKSFQISILNLRFFPKIYFIKKDIQEDSKVKEMRKQTIDFARTMYAKNPLGLVTSFMTKGKLRDSLYMGLSYMRWLDYVADKSEMPYKEKMNFLNNCIQFLNEVRKRDFMYLELSMLHIEERCAYFYIKNCSEELNKKGYSKKTINDIIDSYVLMIKSILQDIENQNRILNADEFYNKIYYLKAGVGMRAFSYALNKNPSKNLLDAFEHFGYIWQLNNDNRDIVEDLDDGIINMTKEEIKKHKIDFKKYKRDYTKLVDYLANETRFFEDRVELLHKWKKIVEKGIPDMPFIYRILMKKYLKVTCPKEFKPGTQHYIFMRKMKKLAYKKGYKFIQILAFLVSEKLALFVLEKYYLRNKE